MRLGVVALDYDGTIAVHGALDPAVRAAILRARERDITVVLVTGRILDELRRVAGDLRFVDAVVAENGAVLAFPATTHRPVPATSCAPCVTPTRARSSTCPGCRIPRSAPASPNRVLQLIEQRYGLAEE